MKKNILIIDDTDDIRLAIKRILESCDCHVFEADAREPAFQILAEQSIDIVFSDLYLPDIEDGELILSEVASKHPGVQVVMMSCAMDYARRSKYCALGAAMCLQKPFFREKCQQVIATLDQRLAA